MPEGEGIGEISEPDDPHLTPRQRLFVDEYLIDLNATQAAIRAGYSKVSAAQGGWQLLRNPNVIRAIETSMERRIQRTHVSQDKIIAELAKIGFSDMRRFTKWGAGGIVLRESHELDADDAICVAEVSQTRSKEGGSLKFRVHDKVAALKLLGQHTGMFGGESDPDKAGGDKTFVIIGGQRIEF